MADFVCKSVWPLCKCMDLMFEFGYLYRPKCGLPFAKSLQVTDNCDETLSLFLACSPFLFVLSFCSAFFCGCMLRMQNKVQPNENKEKSALIMHLKCISFETIEWMGQLGLDSILARCCFFNSRTSICTVELLNVSETFYSWHKFQ